jgi:tetratricopeptide (TPR) repeat protein
MPQARGRGVPVHVGERLTVTAPHVPEPELALLASDPDAIAPTRTLEIHAHLARCTDCADAYDTFVTSFAGDDDEAFLASEGSAAAMAYGARVAREDADAAELLKEYFAKPEKAAYDDLASQRKFVHGGVVRRLAKRAFDVCAKEPLHALIFADAAIAVAEALSMNEYPPNALHDLRGRAWKERANALNRLGKPAAALDALDHAKREYEQVTSNTLGLGNVALVRAATYYYLQRFPDAIREVQIAEELYERLGDIERRTKAMFLRGNVLYELHHFEAASRLFHNVLGYGESIDSDEWIAKGSYALANCVLDTGDIENAALLFSKAIALFRISGSKTDRISAEWGMARVLLARGLFKDSLRRLNDVRVQFTTLGMTAEAALAALDGIEAMVALEMWKQVAELARQTFNTFTEAGMLTSALTALAYIQTAAAEQRLTREAVRDVRAFVKRVEREPDLLFIPPPDPPR